VSILELKRLKALQEEMPKARIALVRLMWPEVKGALNRGHSLMTVHQRLAEAGIDIAYRRLSQCVTRLRREEKLFGVPRSNGGKASAVSKQSSDSHSVGDISETGEGRHSTNANGLADFRERIAKARAFEFQPGPPDESKLI
jgi:hypothetical protein